ncbi:hypothetical protein [Demequina maris]|uniref:hypothetical protein n=1 Tax=Demequina maris TaxID=1638982 RepID=UPI0007844AC2|nr:hypothetical protein [Demequina maris]
MNWTDWLDLGIDLSPRKVIRAALLVLLGAMIIFNWYEPIWWYGNAKAEEIMSAVSSLLAPSPSPLAP